MNKNQNLKPTVSNLSTSSINNTPSSQLNSTASTTSTKDTRYSDQFQKQLADLTSNLKSVKSLTNLYESKQLSLSPPNTSPSASTNTNQNIFNLPLSTTTNSGSQLKLNQQNPLSAANIPNSTIDFNSIFNKYNNVTNGNGANLTNIISNNNFAPVTNNNTQNPTLLSSSSSSTSTSSSSSSATAAVVVANNTQPSNSTNLSNSHHNQQNDFNNNGTNFNSRSLGAFSNSNTTTNNPINTNNNNNNNSFQSIQQQLGQNNGQTETNLSVKNAVKLLESTGNTNIHNINSLNAKPLYSIPSNPNQIGMNKSNLNQSLTNNTLSFNKTKRSSSIDNAINSFDMNVNSQQPLDSMHLNNNGNITHNNPSVYMSNNRLNSLTNNINMNKKSPQVTNVNTSNKNLIFTGHNLKDLLDNFNLNNIKSNNNERPGLGDLNDFIENPNNSAIRSRSLQREDINNSQYFDLNNLKAQQKHQHQQIQQQQQQMANRAKDVMNIGSTNGLNNFSSAYNNSIFNANPLNSKNQYDLYFNSAKFIEESNGQQPISNQTINMSPSHVVPKPPPGNPQRNTNLYPAARY